MPYDSPSEYSFGDYGRPQSSSRRRTSRRRGRGLGPGWDLLSNAEQRSFAEKHRQRRRNRVGRQSSAACGRPRPRTVRPRQLRRGRGQRLWAAFDYPRKLWRLKACRQVWRGSVRRSAACCAGRSQRCGRNSCRLADDLRAAEQRHLAAQLIKWPPEIGGHTCRTENHYAPNFARRGVDNEDVVTVWGPFHLVASDGRRLVNDLSGVSLADEQGD